MDDNNVIIFPAWKQAIEDFLSTGFKPDDIITHEWLRDHFGLDEVDGDTPKRKADVVQIAYMANLKEFRDVLLAEHKILLVSEPRIGYRYVPSNQQAGLSEQHMHKQLKKALDQGVSRIVHTNLYLLTDEQKKEHSDSLARTASLSSAMKKKRRISVSKTQDQLPESTNDN